MPIVLTAPTWVTVGPEEMLENRGLTGCGTLATAPCELGNAGVFSTGLTRQGRTHLHPVEAG